MKNNPLPGQISPGEGRWLMAASLLILLAGSLPYLVGFLNQSEDLHYIGIPFDQVDYAVHTAMIRAGQQGEWTYQLRFSSEPHQPIVIRTFYVWLGGLFPFVEVTLLFHAARLFFGGLALWAVYRVAALWFETAAARRFVFLLATLGSGAGWLLLILRVMPPDSLTPLDLWFIDGYLFRVLLLFPHMAATVFLMASALAEFIHFLRDPHRKRLLLLCGMAVLTQVINPIAFFLIDLAMLAGILLTWKARSLTHQHVLGLGLIGLVQLPLFLYSLQLLTADPVWAIYTAQNRTLSPPPGYIFFGYLPFWLLAAAGLRRAWTETPVLSGMALAWILAALVLIYLPVNIQRRFLIAVTLPLGLLAGVGLQELLPRFSPRTANLLGSAFLGFAMLSNLITLSAYTLDSATQNPRVFFPAGYTRAAAWLREQAAPEDFVLATASTSQILASRSGLKVVFGHPMETLQYEQKSTRVQAFYQGDCSLLEQEPVSWVVYGPDEQQIAQHPPACSGLSEAYSDSTLTIYQRHSP